MNIKNMFEKPIDRDIQGVIKVGQSNDENIFQELDEYVVTNELVKHFRDFFSSYKNGINNDTSKIGVWITGFFGSGKSHLLKILSYLLENREVNGKHAIDYFTDGNKIDDPMIIADMKLAGSVPTDVILFNIDSKSEANSKTQPDAIVNVFLKVFNEMQGFCGSRPYIADLERQLVDENKYDKFKELYKNSSGKEWTETRQNGAFILKHIAYALNELGFMTEEDTRTWYNQESKDYHISIEDFGKMIQNYCSKKGNNHHVVFFVDEVGQYIADNTKLMLNLQTVTENLGIACAGKAWIVVTSQQDIDSVVHVEGQDFSKIQGRFETRLNLSSANVDEVIRKRILAKTPEATDLLKNLYNSKESIIKNLITFSDPVYKKLYENADDFAAVYPFIPYQFNLLGEVLTSVRKHSSSGKHLAEGERSMIALFKESAMYYEEKTEGIFVPFYKFYDALSKFIDHTNSIVISQAQENKLLENPFDTNLLKVLFMIKYVKSIKSNVENLTTLLISFIDQDRLQLKKDVEESLQRLITQTLIQKNGDEYIFLTDEEQEINRAINTEVVDVGEINAKVHDIIFSSIMKLSKYSYTNRYYFQFNQIVDNHDPKQSKEAIGLKFITPYYPETKDESALRLLSSGTGNVIIRLPDESTFLEEVRECLKLEKYLKHNATELEQSHKTIHAIKASELEERKQRAITLIEKAISDAKAYINCDEYISKTTDAENKLKELLHKQVENVFFKLSYMETEPSVLSITNLFTTSNSLGLENTNSENKLALQDMINFIEDNCLNNNRITLKSILQNFTNQPYGFNELDIEYLVAVLFKENKISISIQNKLLSIIDSTPDEITNYLTKRDYQERLIIETKKHISDKQLKQLKDLMNELFVKSVNIDDEEQAASDFRKEAGDLLNKLQHYINEYTFTPELPGKEILETGKDFMEKICAHTMYNQLYDYINKNYDDLMDFAEDSKSVIEFHQGEQINIFKNALKIKHLYDNSKNYISDDSITNQIDIIDTIITQKNPWQSIPMLRQANETFEKIYNNLLQEAKAIQSKVIKSDLDSVNEYLSQNNCTDSFGIKEKFNEIIDRLNNSNDISKVNGFTAEGNTVKTSFINQISQSLIKVTNTETTEPQKVSKPVYLSNVVTNKVVKITTEDDIEEFGKEIIATLKNQLKNSGSSITILL